MESASASRSSMTSSSRSSKHDDHSAPSFPVETIVSFLVEAKKSLGVVELVYDANNIITQAKSGLEAAVIVAAKTKFLRENISEEFKVVKELEKWLKRVREERMEECKVCSEILSGGEHVVLSTCVEILSIGIGNHCQSCQLSSIQVDNHE
jgi:autophagy-related protein 17